MAAELDEEWGCDGVEGDVETDENDNGRRMKQQLMDIGVMSGTKKR
jgi:hypothetical protein